MAKKRYYKRRNYYISKKEKEVNALVASVIFILGGFYLLYIKIILPNLHNIILFLEIFIPLLIIIVGIIVFYIQKNKKMLEKERIKNIPSFLLELENKIKKFRHPKKYKSEELYQTGLYGFLQDNYPNLEIEKTKDHSRPDIIINDIAIEIKGPTYMSSLKTLPDKINQYIPKRDYLFIVLFDINIVPDEEKNIKIYEDKKKEILENTIESKRDKVFFIEL